MSLVYNEEEYLMHYGVLRRSGRYPWGSGGPEYASTDSFLGYAADLKKQGFSEKEIADAFGATTTQLRAAKTIARAEKIAADIATAQALRNKGYSNQAIAERMNLSGESAVRSLLEPGRKDRVEVLQQTSNMLKDQVAQKKYIDVGEGVEAQLGISKEKLSSAVAILREEGYELHTIQVDQVGTRNKTSIKVLAPPGTTYRDIVSDKDNIKQVTDFSEDGGRSYMGIQPPLSVSAKRVGVIYAEDGGTGADGVIYVRPGVDDVSLGGNRYAQVRIAVDGTHYLKGMAVYKDDLPDGVDLMFNTNKSKGTPMMGSKDNTVLKPVKDDAENPFGATTRQILDPKTGKPKSAMNLVNEEGDWDNWSRNLAPQFLSKQSPKLAQEQLDMTYERRKKELDEILSLTNPAVKQKLLESYSDSVDSAAVHLKAASLPRQSSHVILPVNSMKETEVYAPNFKDGERVALVRFPHGGKFEIPELTVNNRNREAVRLLSKNPKDAIGINSKVAERLSGADFDGDSVLVIPNNSGKIKSSPALQDLKNFDPQRDYPAYPGMPKMSARTKQKEMGMVSNLITDMTIRGASESEIARAVRHSMVVIDAEKHNLNYKLSAKRNGISQLTKKYQSEYNSTGRGGASTLISKAKSRVDIDAKTPRPARMGGPIDPATGKLVYIPKGEPYLDKKTGKMVMPKQVSKKLAETDDAFTLSSGTVIENIYANHSNRLKALANEARKAQVAVKSTPYSPAAATAYAKEVASLNDKLHTAVKNRPLERQAQVVANTLVKAKVSANPEMSDDELKKVKSQALIVARLRTGASKQRIAFTQAEWNAIQAGAISNHRLNEMLKHADLDVVKQLATPKDRNTLTSTMSTRARSMINQGYTQAEVAEQLGVSVNTLKNSLD